MPGRPLLAAVLLGQLLAVFIAITATCSTLLANQGISAPTLQSALNYLLLALCYSHIHLRKQPRWLPLPLSKPWWTYALLALLDVEANFLLVLAYRYTSLTSVTLLDCFTIPCVVLLSAVVLGARYRRGHFAGAGICLAGLSLLVLTDRSSGGGDAGRTWLGDGLVLVGAALYAASNVVQEKLLGDVSVEELLAMEGAFGVLWSAVQGLPLELGTLRAASWAPSAALPFLGFGLAMFSFYSLVPYELRWGGASLLNLSLLSSDLWTALARQLLFGGFSGNSFAYFLLSFLIVAGGIVVYTASGDVYSTSGPGSRGSEAGEAAAGLHKAGAGSSRHEYAALGPSEESEGTCAAAGHAAEAGLLAPDSFAGEDCDGALGHHPPRALAGSLVQGPIEGALGSRSSEEGALESGGGTLPPLPPVRVQGQAGADVLHFGIESPPASWRGVRHGRSSSP